MRTVITITDTRVTVRINENKPLIIARPGQTELQFDNQPPLDEVAGQSFVPTLESVLGMEVLGNGAEGNFGSPAEDPMFAPSVKARPAKPAYTSRLLTKTCSSCNQPYQVESRKAGPSKYCDDCKTKFSAKQPITKPCKIEGCDKKIVRWPGQQGKMPSLCAIHRPNTGGDIKLERSAAPVEGFSDPWKCAVCRDGNGLCSMHTAMEAKGQKAPRYWMTGPAV